MKLLLPALFAGFALSSCGISEHENARNLAIAEGYYNIAVFDKAIENAMKVERRSEHFKKAQLQITEAKMARNDWEQRPLREGRIEAAYR